MQADQKEVVEFFLENRLFVAPDALSLDLDRSLAQTALAAGLMVIGKKEAELLESNPDADWGALEHTKAMAEMGLTPENYHAMLRSIGPDSGCCNVNVVSTYTEAAKKRDVQDFVGLFNSRYRAIESILKNRPELQSTVSINRILSKSDRENVALVGLVSDKRETKNNNILMTVEDPTGEIKVLVSKDKPDLIAQAKEILPDETIGITGMSGDQIIFANSLLWPDTPLNFKLKKAPEPGYAIFLSDLHVGSNNFLEDKFNRFLDWINGDVGSKQQREIAKKTKYVFIVGDLVDGVGIYPNQQEELSILDIYDQYAECARLLNRIPKHISVIICAGNHDAVRIAEPQPRIPQEFANTLYSSPNIISLSNPSWVNIHSSKDFPGFDVLLYHGYSMDYYVANSDCIRNQGGYDRPDILMKYLMTRRHLAPTHTSTLYIPERTKDPLVIDKVPDIFATGHIHKSAALTYRSITMVCGSCWQSKTSFQEKVGHNPEPGRVPALDLQTRELKILRF
ncbi:MAG: DNA-directed DNA polymerase II small subunit [Nanoarchaeota archaeon]|nr:DNA-directed DNA polymerase II small subunit [Nanoarchaeota archaeon]